MGYLDAELPSIDDVLMGTATVTRRGETSVDSWGNTVTDTDELVTFEGVTCAIQERGGARIFDQLQVKTHDAVLYLRRDNGAYQPKEGDRFSSYTVNGVVTAREYVLDAEMNDGGISHHWKGLLLAVDPIEKQGA